MSLLNSPTRIIFFTGKGGVGKTSLACALAVGLADLGRRVLLVSTDPASNLDEVLGRRLSGLPTAIPRVRGLSALNINPEEAAREYRERVVGRYRGVLPRAAVASIEERLSGACTVEIAAFDEFSKLLGNPKATRGFDHVIFDTAPTGHTLRLLNLPSAWSGFIADNASGTSCLGPLAGLRAQRSLYEASVRALIDPARTTIVLVSRPEPSALGEAERTRKELARLGIASQRLALNGVFRATNGDAVAMALARRHRAALAAMPAPLRRLARSEVPLLPFAPLGIDGLRAMLGKAAPPPPISAAACRLPPSLAGLIAAIERQPGGVIMTMGKGGVGKTTLAAAIAVALARRGHKVRLSTTDPAAHVAETVGGGTRGLSISRIDPAVETEAYRAEVMATSGRSLDARGRALLREDLRSPCTEEVAVFRAFARTVAEGRDGFVILDTAPTGHTILLLDAARAYHREVERRMGDVPEAVQKLLPRLRAPGFTRILLVTLPEATPVHEAVQLQRDLARAGIAPYAWIVNQSLLPLKPGHPTLSARRALEQKYVREVARHCRRVAIVPWVPENPTGPDGLMQIVGQVDWGLP